MIGMVSLKRLKILMLHAHHSAIPQYQRPPAKPRCYSAQGMAVYLNSSSVRPASLARAIRCSTALVEPPTAYWKKQPTKRASEQ